MALGPMGSERRHMRVPMRMPGRFLAVTCDSPIYRAKDIRQQDCDRFIHLLAGKA